MDSMQHVMGEMGEGLGIGETRPAFLLLGLFMGEWRIALAAI